MLGISIIFYGVPTALIIWFFIWARWAGLHEQDQSTIKQNYSNYLNQNK